MQQLQCMRCGGPPAALVQTSTSAEGQPILTPLCVPCMASLALPAQFTGTVETPPTPLPPNSPMFGALKEAKSRTRILELREQATRQGYSSGGQLMTAIADRLAALDRPKRKGKTTPKKATRRT